MFSSNIAMFIMMMIVARMEAVAIVDTTNGPNLQDGIISDVALSTSPTVDGSIGSASNDSIMASCAIDSNRHIALLNQQNVEGHILLWQNINQTGPLKMSLRLNGFKVDCSPQNLNNTTGCRSIQPDDNDAINNSTANGGDDDAGNPSDNSFIKAFGMHIHEGSDTTFGCQSVGNHYNPFNMTHGGPNDTVKHLGDLGNIYADHTGAVNMELSFDDLSLFGNYSILNRAIVIHSGPDDYGRSNNPASKITGNSGIRIACCIIETMMMMK